MIETRKQYDEFPYETEFEARVLSVSGEGDSRNVILDRTLFFPEEGGQSCDRGILEGCPVTDVQIEEGVITHTVRLSEPSAEFVQGQSVHGRIDWNHRFSNMQNHTGEHILSGILYRAYGYENVGFHLSDHQVTFDTSGPLTKQQVAQLEREANGIVWRNLAVSAEYPDPETLERTEYRSKGEVSGRVRLVSIEDTDVCACCAPHVRRTGEVGQIRIVKAESYKGGMRFTILCGMRAYEDERRNREQLEDLSHLLLASQDGITEAVQRVLDENQRLKEIRIRDQERRIERLAQEALQTTAEEVWLFEEDLDPVPQRNLVNRICGDAGRTAGVFVGTDTDGYRFVIGSSQDARRYCDAMKRAFGCRGGGSAQMVQGTAHAVKADIRELFAAGLPLTDGK